MNYGSIIEFMTSSSHKLLNTGPKIIICDIVISLKCVFVTLNGV